MKQSRQFILSQARVLASLGYTEEQIARVLRWVEAHMPAGADPATWVPSEADMTSDVLTEDSAQDAIEAWRKSRAVPKAYKGLLDATEVE